MKHGFAIVLILCLGLIACQGDGHAPQQPTETTEAPAPPPQPKAALDPNTIDEATRAEASCDCFRKLYETRQEARENYQKGDSTAFTGIEDEMRRIRREAKECALKLVAPLRTDEGRKKEYQAILSKTCPNYSTSILLMTKLNFIPDE